MSQPTEDQNLRTCHWTGEESNQKHYVLVTTEGQEVVSEKALRAAPEDTADQLAYLTQTLAKLTRRVAVLEGGKPASTAAKKAAAKNAPESE